MCCLLNLSETEKETLAVGAKESSGLRSAGFQQGRLG